MNFDDVMHRIKNLQCYEVGIQIPEDFMFEGRVPFDMTIDNHGNCWATVYALDEDEAVAKVKTFFGLEDDGYPKAWYDED
jgi:hypothetical protein